MRYKLLALDLDDTLLNEEYKISQNNIEALQRAAKAGVIITIATGRMFRSALPFARQLAVDVPIITYHGALIKKAVGEEVIWHRPVPLEIAEEITRYAVKKGYHMNLFINDRLYAAEENKYTRYYQSITDVGLKTVGDVSAFLEGEKVPPTKMNILSFDENMEDIVKDITDKFGKRVTVTQSRPHFLEVTHLEATKGKALKHLAEEAGIKREEVAAIGDSLNDVDMLEYAGCGVAVANAREEVKEVAQVITLTNIEDGVAYFIDNYILV